MMMIILGMLKAICAGIITICGVGILIMGILMSDEKGI